MNLEHYEKLKHMILQRELARVNKEAGKERPWCGDEFINKHRFTNVNRINDKHNSTVHKAIQAKGDMTFNEILFTYYLSTIYRTEDMLYYINECDGNLDKFFERVVDEDGIHRRLNAYIVRIIAHEDCVELISNLQKHFNSLTKLSELDFDEIMSFMCMGEFSTNQIAVYVREGITLGILDKDQSSDHINTWFDFSYYAGTGYGCRLLFDNKCSKKLILELQHTLQNEPHLVNISFDEINDVCNCLCEYTKYDKVSNGVRTTIRSYK